MTATLTPTDELAQAYGFRDYSAYLATPHWREQKRRAHRRAGRRCEWTSYGRRCKRRRGLIVHHLTYDRFGAEAMDDLLVVCQEHHNEAHSRHDAPVIDVGDSGPRRRRSPWVRDAATYLLRWLLLAALLVFAWGLMLHAQGKPLPPLESLPWPSWGELRVWGAAALDYGLRFAVLLVRTLAGMAWEAARAVVELVVEHAG